MATLTVRAVDPDGGTGPARFYVTDGSGHAVYPASPHIAVRNDRTWASERHFVADGRADVDLPAGQVSVAAERGPEFVPQSVELELQPDEHRAIDLVVPRWVDMNARGWFSGDLHVHRDARDMPRLLGAEDLNVGTCIATHWRDVPVTANRMPPESDDWLSIVDATHAFSRLDAEVERLGAGPGAIVAVGLRHPLMFQCDRWYPPDSDFADHAHAAGGHVDAEKPVWDTVPVLAALGRLDSVGVVCNHFARGGTELDLETWGARPPPTGRIGSAQELARWICAIYYGLLNSGFRLPASGGSASDVIPNPLGYNRTYVRLDGVFSYQAWLRALRRGRSFATNGPMLTLTANGAGIGDQIAVAAGETLRVRARAESQTPLDRIELVLDGEIVDEAVCRPGRTELRLERDLRIEAPGWLAARAFGGAEPNMHFAHTSPIYIATEGEPRRRAEHARQLGAWVDGYATRAARELREAPDDRRDAVLAPIRQASEVYRSVSSRA